MGCEKRGMEDLVDLPSGGDAEVQSGLRDDILNFKWASSFHLEFLGSSHIKIHHLQLYLITNLPWSKLA